MKRCVNCSKVVKENEPKYSSKDYWGMICKSCFYMLNFKLERENMPNIKITAEVDGKIVPLNTISTESFEAIKALEKPKEIPVARVGNWVDDGSQKRLFLKVTKSLIKHIGSAKSHDIILAIDPEDGIVATQWSVRSDESCIRNYGNVRPL